LWHTPAINSAFSTINEIFMNLNKLNRFTGAAALALLIFCGACSTSTIPLKVTGQESFAGSQDFGGEIVVNAIQTTNTVLAIDPAHRRVTLKNLNGKIRQYKAGPQVVNFNQLKVGDVVKATVVERMSIFLRADSSAQSLSSSSLVVHGLPGAKPDVLGVETLDFTATILDINNWLDQVTLQGVDGLTRTVTVGESVNLADYQVGDQVSVRITEALAILIEKP
jgi:hypothetical protein